MFTVSWSHKHLLWLAKRKLSYKIQRCLKSTRLVVTAHVCKIVIAVPSLDIFRCKISHTRKYASYVSPRLVWSCLAVDAHAPVLETLISYWSGEDSLKRIHAHTEIHTCLYCTCVGVSLWHIWVYFLTLPVQRQCRDLIISSPLLNPRHYAPPYSYFSPFNPSPCLWFTNVSVTIKLISVAITPPSPRRQIRRADKECCCLKSCQRAPGFDF